MAREKLESSLFPTNSRQNAAAALEYAGQEGESQQSYLGRSGGK